jgi:predicted RNase H-like HicB family nuclease
MTLKGAEYVLIGQTEDGAFVASSVEAPYFCFEGSSEADVIAKAKGALAFFAKHSDNTKPERVTKKKTLDTVVPSRRIRFDELVAA